VVQVAPEVVAVDEVGWRRVGADGPWRCCRYGRGTRRKREFSSIQHGRNWQPPHRDDEGAPSGVMLLFVMVDGCALVCGGVAASFR
jgi:hypothetical protein